MTDRINIFVYGSLFGKRAEIIDAAIAQGLAEHKYQAQTTKNYDLLDFGTFPGMIYGNYAIGGEIFSVTPEVLALLDEFEGHPRLYTRQTITLYVDDLIDIPSESKIECADAYIFNMEDDGKLLLDVIRNDHPNRVSCVRSLSKSLKIWWD